MFECITARKETFNCTKSMIEANHIAVKRGSKFDLSVIRPTERLAEVKLVNLQSKDSRLKIVLLPMDQI